MEEKFDATNLNSILFIKENLKNACLMFPLPLTTKSRQEITNLCFYTLDFPEFMK